MLLAFLLYLYAAAVWTGFGAKFGSDQADWRTAPAWTVMCCVIFGALWPIYPVLWIAGYFGDPE